MTSRTGQLDSQGYKVKPCLKTNKQQKQDKTKKKKKNKSFPKTNIQDWQDGEHRDHPASRKLGLHVCTSTPGLSLECLKNFSAS